jgi:predicted ester cyclase
MSEEIKAKVRQIYDEALNKGNVDVLDELVAVEYVRNQPPMKQVIGVPGFKTFIEDVRSAYSDFEISIEGIIVEGDRSAIQITLSGRHTGQAPTLQAPPTGKQIAMKSCSLGRWKDGKLVEEWVYSDYLGLMQQFGVIPLPGLFA